LGIYPLKLFICFFLLFYLVFVKFILGITTVFLYFYTASTISIGYPLIHMLVDTLGWKNNQAS